MRLLLATSALLAGGCVPQPHGDPVPPVPPENAECNAVPAQGLVGRQASPDLAAEAQRLAGARIWRWLRPGQMVTMEYRADRLNIRLDARDRVEGVSCG